MAKRYSESIEHNGVILNIENLIKFKNERLLYSNKNERAIFESAVKFFIDNGRFPTEKDMESSTYKTKYKNIEMNMQDLNYISGIDDFYKRDIEAFMNWYSSEEGQKQIRMDNPNIAFDEETGIIKINKETGRPESGLKNETTLNPYVQWLENQRQTAESQHYGLLDAQTRTGMQNAEISAQQAMMQQAKFKDDLVEQIKLDRMSKMRKGISPMQIAQENLQFMVGNMQGANQQIGAVNQSRLGALQQQELNPYQAYLNSLEGAGYQSQANFGAGAMASDASDLYMQALRMQQAYGMNPTQALNQSRGTEVVINPNKKKDN